jgi:succinate dehydrogenase / fumarate reductase cytochrome b subunit
LLSSISAKGVMALTGLALTLFVIAHLLGNLQLYLGRDALNAYAAKLQGIPEVLWPFRIGLLTVFVVHIVLGIRLVRRNRQARPVAYAFPNTRKASTASQTMLLTGLVLLAFVVVHLSHFTLGIIQPETFAHDFRDSKGRYDVYFMTVKGFREWWMSLFYVVSMVVLGIHLSHGVSSTFQSLGLNPPRWATWIKRGGLTLAMAVMIGNISMPVAVLLGIVGGDVP